MHEAHGVAHLDVKPENILVSRNYTAKLCDFDTVLPLGKRVQKMRGTPEYHPPENFLRSAWYTVSEGSDVWALALVSFEVLHGSYAWEFPNSNDEGWVNFQANNRSAHEPWKFMSHSLLDYFDAGLDPNPKKRSNIADLKGFIEQEWIVEAQAFKVARLTGVQPSPAKPPQVDNDVSQLTLQAVRPALNNSGHWIVNVVPIDCGNHHKYQIVCSPPAESAKVGRLACCERYSKLLALHRTATSLFPTDTPTSFPRKKIVGRKQTEFVLRRAEGLAEYFESAMTIETIKSFWAEQPEMITVAEDPTIGAPESSNEFMKRAPLTESADDLMVTPLDEDGFSKLPWRTSPDPAAPSTGPVAAANSRRNRYKDIHVKWDTRVKLKLFSSTDYINANYIHDRTGKRSFISAQAPLPNYLSEWWQMIWTEGVTVIVMLSKLVEKDVCKVHRYWPEELVKSGDDHGVDYGTFSVHWRSTEVRHGFSSNELEVRHQGKSRTITHIWVQSWPDFGVPTTRGGLADPIDTLALIDYVRAQREPGTGPVLVHCSAGVGRTGTVIAIDQAIDELHETGKVDMLSVIKRLRKNRYNMVQRVAQYKFAWQAVISHAKALLAGRPRAGTICSLSSSLSSKASARLRRESRMGMDLGIWELQTRGEDEVFVLKPDATPIKISAKDDPDADTAVAPATESAVVLGEQHLGLSVKVSGYKSHGRLRFVGLHAVHKTPRVGVELEAAEGKNDGTVAGHTYFHCAAGHGLLTHPNKVTLIDNDVDIERLTIGARVAVQGYPTLGTLRFYGEHHINPSVRCGVELDAPFGRNNGTVRGHEYFKCPRNHGVLVSPKKVRVLSAITDGDVNKAVVVKGYGCHGVLKYFGPHSAKSGLRAGVELNLELGKNNGTVGGHKYFECDDDCGVLVNPDKVSLIEELEEMDSFISGGEGVPGEPFLSELQIGQAEVAEQSASDLANDIAGFGIAFSLGGAAGVSHSLASFEQEPMAIDDIELEMIDDEANPIYAMASDVLVESEKSAIQSGGTLGVSTIPSVPETSSAVRPVPEATGPSELPDSAAPTLLNRNHEQTELAGQVQKETLRVVSQSGDVYGTVRKVGGSSEASTADMPRTKSKKASKTTHLKLVFDRPTSGAFRGFGFGFATEEDGKKLITKVMSGGASHRKLVVGDVVLTINGTAVNTAAVTHETVVKMISSSEVQLVMEVSRRISKLTVAIDLQQDESMEIGACRNTHQPMDRGPEQSAVRMCAALLDFVIVSLVLLSDRRYCIVVTLVTDPLGSHCIRVPVCLCDSKELAKAGTGVEVTVIKDSSPAKGKLKVGDLLLEAAGQSLGSLSISACETLVNTGPSVVLRLQRVTNKRIRKDRVPQKSIRLREKVCASQVNHLCAIHTYVSISNFLVGIVYVFFGIPPNT